MGNYGFVKEVNGKKYITVRDDNEGICKGCSAFSDDHQLCGKLNIEEVEYCDGVIWQEMSEDSLATQILGTKYDDNKLDYTLIPPHALQELARNLTEGLKKYRERDNWKKVPNAQERYLKALYRHLEAHRRGEIYDTESSAENMPHLAAVAVNAMFLLEFMLDPKLKEGNQE